MHQAHGTYRKLKLDLPATLDAIEEADDCMCAWLKPKELPLNLFGLRILLHEALLNAVTHGSQEDPNLAVSMSVELRESNVVFVRRQFQTVATLTVRPPNHLHRTVAPNKMCGGPLVRSRVTFENRIFHERADLSERLTHGASRRRRYEHSRKPDRNRIDVHANKTALQLDGFQCGNTRTEKRVNHQTALRAKMLDEITHRFSRLLAPVFVEGVKAAIRRRVSQRGHRGRLGKFWKGELHQFS